MWLLCQLTINKYVISRLLHISSAMNDPTKQVRRFVDRLLSTELGTTPWSQIIDELHGLGPAAIPALLNHLVSSDLSDEIDTRRALRLALVKIGKDDVDDMVEWLQHEDAKRRTLIADVLRTMVWRHRAEMSHLVPVLAKAQSDPDWEVRMYVANTLCGLQEFARPAIPELIIALKDEISNVREAAVDALDLIGAIEAEGPLTECLLDDVAFVRNAASLALDSIRDRKQDGLE